MSREDSRPTFPRSCLQRRGVYQEEMAGPKGHHLGRPDSTNLARFPEEFCDWEDGRADDLGVRRRHLQVHSVADVGQVRASLSNRLGRWSFQRSFRRNVDDSIGPAAFGEHAAVVGNYSRRRLKVRLMSEMS